MEQSGNRKRPGIYFWVLAAFLLIIALTGGSNRQDVVQLVVLRPVSVLLLGFAIWGIAREELRLVRVPLALLCAILVLAILQLLPLPPGLWVLLPGRDEIERAQELAGIHGQWRSTSVVSFQTTLFAFGLFTPLAVLLLAARCTAQERWLLLPVLIVVGIVSILLGLLQQIGADQNFLYLYRITNFGSPVGLFANRNHQAIFLAALLPVLAAVVATLPTGAGGFRVARYILAATGVLLVAMLLVIGSRNGIIVGLIALVILPVILARAEGFSRLQIGVAAVALLVLVGSFALASRTQSLDRLMATGANEERRARAFLPVVDRVRQYFPVGAGYGTFVEVYKLHEPTETLSERYLNRAHNDPLELLLEAGLPGALIGLAAIGAWLVGAWRLFLDYRRRGRREPLAVAGYAVLLVIGLASVGDYPARVPIVQMIAMIACLWCLDPGKAWKLTSDRHGGGSRRRRRLG